MTAKEIYRKYSTLFNKNKVNTKLRLSHFFGQAEIEVGEDFKPKQENLNYSVEGLLANFGSHRISDADAKKFGRTPTKKANQKEIANRIYGGEWGKKNLGNIYLNDGSTFIGRGLYQITGRTNYEKLSKDTGIDFVNNPELILEEANSIIAALHYWTTRDLNSYADKDDSTSISKTINLGNPKAKGIPKHLTERKQATEKYKKIF